MSMDKMSSLEWISFILLVVGGLNWGLVALNFNLVSWLFGTSVVANVVYGLVGISALYAIISAIKKK